MRFQSGISALLIVLGVVPLASAAACNAPTAGAPYAVSTARCLNAVPATIEHHGCAGAQGPNCTGWNFNPAQADQWVMTWASDNNVYGMWGDGRGWNGAIADGAIGMTRMTDDPPTMAATDVYTFGSRNPNYKVRAVLGESNGTMIGFYDDTADSWDGSYTMTSSNNGTTWTFDGGTPVFKKSVDGFTVVAMAQAGPGYTGLPASVSASYYYIYGSCWTGNGGCADYTHTYLGRVPKANWKTKASYEWYNGLDGSNNPIWSSNIATKQAVFGDTTSMGFFHGVFYNPYWQRWIFSTAHSSAGCTTNESCRLGIFESQYLWGPWKTLYYGDFLDTFWKFSYQTPQKWMAADGSSFWLAWSGWPEYDNVNFVRFDVTALGETLAPEAPANLHVLQP